MKGYRAAQAAHDDLSPDETEEWEGECPSCEGVTTNCILDGDDCGTVAWALNCDECAWWTCAWCDEVEAPSLCPPTKPEEWRCRSCEIEAVR